jgi:hypothetical protein
MGWKNNGLMHHDMHMHAATLLWFGREKWMNEHAQAHDSPSVIMMH